MLFESLEHASTSEQFHGGTKLGARDDEPFDVHDSNDANIRSIVKHIDNRPFYGGSRYNDHRQLAGSRERLLPGGGELDRTHIS